MRYAWPGNVRELGNVVEHACCVAVGDVAGPEALPPTIVDGAKSAPIRFERRRQPADTLYAALKTGECRFWDDVYPRFLQRDLTRHDLRSLVRLGLRDTGGKYRSLLPLLGIAPSDYKRFMNFLAAHGCSIESREFREPIGGTSLDATDASGSALAASGR
jgi:DNA-binding NtrC family response regulator